MNFLLMLMQTNRAINPERRSGPLMDLAGRLAGGRGGPVK
jgi:hypothetical protein